MPNPAEVYYHPTFQFEDGETSPKLFIVLGNCEKDLVCLVLKTTSREKRYENVKIGCNSEEKIFFITKEWQKFKENTFVVLRPIYPIPWQELIREGIKEEIRRVLTLEPDCFRQLLNCLRKNIQEDISEEHYKSIFK
jgi:hypothetical protein